MYHVVYISSATFPVSETELETFLQRWRCNNERDNVTGMLLYSEREGRFIQVIEGEQTAILTLFHKIEHDLRHRSLQKLADGPILQRNFTSWLMGFKVLTTAAFTQFASYIDPASPVLQQVLANTNDALIRQLLEAFNFE